MEFRQLEYFVAVAEAGTMSRAADRVGVSQPALSKAVAKLGSSRIASRFETRNRAP